MIDFVLGKSFHFGGKRSQESFLSTGIGFPSGQSHFILNLLGAPL